jgi:uncharacterized membrane protein YfcA
MAGKKQVSPVVAIVVIVVVIAIIVAIYMVMGNRKKPDASGTRTPAVQDASQIPPPPGDPMSKMGKMQGPETGGGGGMQGGGGGAAPPPVGN